MHTLTSAQAKALGDFNARCDFPATSRFGGPMRPWHYGIGPWGVAHALIVFAVCHGWTP